MGVFLEQPGDFVSRHGATQQIALEQVAALLLQELSLEIGFDTFSHHFQVELMGEGDGRRGDGLIHTVRPHVLHEGAVDLDALDGNTPQQIEGRLAGAEVVEADGDAQGDDRPQGFERPLRSLKRGGFGDLEFQRFRLQAGRIQRGRHQ